MVNFDRRMPIPSDDEVLAIKLFKERRAHEFKLIVDRLLESPTLTMSEETLLFYRALFYERGEFGEVDLERAYEDFKYLHDRKDLYGKLGTVGMARVLVKMDVEANADRAIELFLEAISRESGTEAMMRAGELYERQKRDYRSAAIHYLEAYLSGQPWGLRYYVKMHRQIGHPIRAFLAYVLFIITAPAFKIFQGNKGPFD